MIKFIEKATMEFNKNGRSVTFINMENKVISKLNPLQIYFFARYAKGASVTRLQPAILKCCTLEQGYYFVKNVKCANLRPFMEKAVEENNKFWIEKFIELAKNTNKYKSIQDLANGFVPSPKPEVLNGKTFNINEAIICANNEHKLYGRSNDFVAIENYCMHSNLAGDSNLFIQCVDGADVRAFERAAILKGDPFQMYIIANGVRCCNLNVIYKALQMAKLDYNEIEASDAERLQRRQEIIEKFESAETIEERELLRAEYNKLPPMPEYIINIDNYYLPRVMYLMREKGLKF